MKVASIQDIEKAKDAKKIEAANKAAILCVPQQILENDEL